MASISIKKAALINAGAKYSQVIIQLILNMILSRILSPEDYGVMAIITVFTTFFLTFSNLGFGSAIIQNKRLTKNDTDNIYSFTCYIAIFISILFCLFSYPLSLMYKSNIYIYIGCLLSLSLLFNTLNMVPNALLMKEKKFIKVGIRNVTVTIMTSIIAIILAFVGFKYYALAIQSILTAFFTYTWNYYSTRPKFVFKFQFSSIKKIAGFSAFQFGFNIVQYFSRNLDHLLTGGVISSVALGYYDKAYKLTRYPVENLAQVITPVLHPILSDYQSDQAYIFRQYQKITKLLSLVAIYITVIFGLCSKEVMLIMFGSQWTESIDCLQIFSVTIWLQMLGACTGAIFQSLGKTNLLFITGLMNSVITAGGFAIGIMGGTIEDVAISFSITSFINFFVSNYMLVRKGFGENSLRFIRRFIPELGIALVMVLFYKLVPINIDNIYVSMLLKGILLTLAYICGILIFRQYKYLKIIFVKFKKRKKC